MLSARLAFVCLAAATASPHGAAADLALATSTGYEGSERTTITPQTLTFDPRVAPLRVLSVPAETRAGDATLADLARHLVERRELGRHDWAVLNGGLSAFRTDVPLGLLVVDGKTLGTLSREKAPGTAAMARPAGATALRWAGILCQGADKRWQILASERYQPGLCRQAIQSGPVLVEPGAKAAIGEDEPRRTRPYARSAVCLMPDGRMRFVIVTQPTHLLPFARWLASPAGGGCDAALNLSGDSSSGLYLHAARSPGVLIGPASFPLPSALFVQSTR